MNIRVKFKMSHWPHTVEYCTFGPPVPEHQCLIKKQLWVWQQLKYICIFVDYSIYTNFKISIHGSKFIYSVDGSVSQSVFLRTSVPLRAGIWRLRGPGGIWNAWPNGTSLGPHLESCCCAIWGSGWRPKSAFLRIPSGSSGMQVVWGLTLWETLS